MVRHSRASHRSQDLVGGSELRGLPRDLKPHCAHTLRAQWPAHSCFTLKGARGGVVMLSPRGLPVRVTAAECFADATASAAFVGVSRNLEPGVEPGTATLPPLRCLELRWTHSRCLLRVGGPPQQSLTPHRDPRASWEVQSSVGNRACCLGTPSSYWE